MALDHPVIQSVLVPLAVSLLLTGGVQFALGARWAERLAGIAIGLGVLAAYVLAFGSPDWPLRTGVQKLPLVLVLLMGGGVVIGTIRPSPAVSKVIGTAAVAMMALWLGWPQLTHGGRGQTFLLAATTLCALAALAALLRAGETGTNRPATLVMVSLGLAGASLQAGSLALFQISLALAAALGGFSLWSWPRPRLAFAASALAVGGFGGVAAAMLVLLLTEIRPWSMLPLALAFAAGPIARRLPVPARFARAAVEPLYIAVMAGSMAATTVMLAAPALSLEDPYYR